MQPAESIVEADDGVDVSLIRWFLTLTPDERLDALENFVNDILELRDAGRAVSPNP